MGIWSCSHLKGLSSGQSISSLTWAVFPLIMEIFILLWEGSTQVFRLLVYSCVSVSGLLTSGAYPAYSLVSLPGLLLYKEAVRTSPKGKTLGWGLGRQKAGNPPFLLFSLQSGLCWGCAALWGWSQHAPPFHTFSHSHHSAGCGGFPSVAVVK